jgi:hypothetical protein
MHSCLKTRFISSKCDRISRPSKSRFMGTHYFLRKFGCPLRVLIQCIRKSLSIWELSPTSANRGRALVTKETLHTTSANSGRRRFQIAFRNNQLQKSTESQCTEITCYTQNENVWRSRASGKGFAFSHWKSRCTLLLLRMNMNNNLLMIMD